MQMLLVRRSRRGARTQDRLRHEFHHRGRRDNLRVNGEADNQTLDSRTASRTLVLVLKGDILAGVGEEDRGIGCSGFEWRKDIGVELGRRSRAVEIGKLRSYRKPIKLRDRLAGGAAVHRSWSMGYAGAAVSLGVV